MKRSAWIAGAAALAASSPALACPNCIAAQDANVQWAFLVASIGMTFLPLLLIGGSVWWLWRRAQRLAAEEAAGVIRLPSAPVRPRSGA